DGEELSYIWTGPSLPAKAVVGVSPTVTLPVGTHTLTLYVQDGSSPIASDTVVVTVTAPAPQIESLTASPSSLGRPDGRMVDVTVTPQVQAGCSASATCRIGSVATAAPAGPGGVGQTPGPPPVKRGGTGAGGGAARAYTIPGGCRLGGGPASRKTVKVEVPPAGRMTGEGEIEKGDREYEYSF